MTIDQMIEAAAKAAGIPIRRIDDGWEVRFVDMRGEGYEPNINGQQSFDLAAALRISVEHNSDACRQPWVRARIDVSAWEAKIYQEDVADEAQRADRMRLAILRCAAAQAPKTVGTGGPENGPEIAKTRMDTGFHRGPGVAADLVLLEGGETCPR